MFKKILTGWGVAAMLAACGTVKLDAQVAGQPDEPAAEAADLPNPASAYCDEQGHTLDIRTDAEGNQYGVCVFAAGGECDEWAYFRGECGPETGTAAPKEKPVRAGEEVAVTGWLGYVVNLPAEAEYDDKVVLVPEGTGEFGLTGATAELEDRLASLRDTAEPGKFANFWGTLTCDVPDVNGCQLVVEQIRTGQETTAAEPVEGWEGTLISNEAGAQFDDAFVLAGDIPVRFGLSSAVGMNGELELREVIDGLRDTGVSFQVWGDMLCGVPDVNGCQIRATRIEAGGEVYAVTAPAGGGDAPTADLETYKNDEYGFAFDYQSSWALEEAPQTINLRRNDILLHITYKRDTENWIEGVHGTGMPAGDFAEAQAVPFLGQMVVKRPLVFEGKTKVVTYALAGGEPAGGLNFMFRLDDLGYGDYSELEVSEALQSEVEQILFSFRILE